MRKQMHKFQQKSAESKQLESRVRGWRKMMKARAICLLERRANDKAFSFLTYLYSCA